MYIQVLVHVCTVNVNLFQAYSSEVTWKCTGTSQETGRHHSRNHTLFTQTNHYEKTLLQLMHATKPPLSINMRQRLKITYDENIM